MFARFLLHLLRRFLEILIICVVSEIVRGSFIRCRHPAPLCTRRLPHPCYATSSLVSLVPRDPVMIERLNLFPGLVVGFQTMAYGLHGLNVLICRDTGWVKVPGE
jgi:hypothetical protein